MGFGKGIMEPGKGMAAATANMGACTWGESEFWLPEYGKKLSLKLVKVHSDGDGERESDNVSKDDYPEGKKIRKTQDGSKEVQASPIKLNSWIMNELLWVEVARFNSKEKGKGEWSS